MQTSKEKSHSFRAAVAKSQEGHVHWLSGPAGVVAKHSAHLSPQLTLVQLRLSSAMQDSGVSSGGLGEDNTPPKWGTGRAQSQS